MGGNIKYLVCSLKDLKVIVNHFDWLSLITQKGSDFQLFKQVVELMQRREHLTIEGLNKYYQLKRAANFSMPGSAHCIK